MTENVGHVGTFIQTSKLAAGSPPYKMETQERSKGGQESQPRTKIGAQVNHLENSRSLTFLSNSEEVLQ